MSQKKKIRAAFRDAVFARDKDRCKICGRNDVKLDAHHITDRHEMPNGGYVVENGITLCDGLDSCHAKAEQWHAVGMVHTDFAPDQLYYLIGSSRELAEESSNRL